MVLVLVTLFLALEAYEVPCNWYKPYTYGYLRQNNEVCKDCNCDLVGSHSQHCSKENGACFCKRGHTTRSCNKCREGYWKLPDQSCRDCECSSLGSVSTACSSSGGCECKTGYIGPNCNICDLGFIGNSSGLCSGCDSCSTMLLTSLAQAQAAEESIQTFSQDFYITRATAKLKKLRNKSNRIMAQISEKIAVLHNMDDTAVTRARELLYSGSRRNPSLPRQADKLMIKSIESSQLVTITVAHGLDDVMSLNSRLLNAAYYKYEEIRNKLPQRLANLTVTRKQLRALSKEVRRMNNDYISDILTENQQLGAQLRPLVERSQNRSSDVKKFKAKVRDKRKTVATLTDQIRLLEASLAEAQLEGSTDVSILHEAKARQLAAEHQLHTFGGWKGDVKGFVNRTSEKISRIGRIYHLQNVTLLMSDVQLLRRTILDLPGTIALPPALDSTMCSGFTLVPSLYNMFSSVLEESAHMEPVRSVEHIKLIIENMQRVTQYQVAAYESKKYKAYIV